MKKISLSLFGVLFLLAFVACKKDKPAAETVTDIDGNVYKTIKIGTQTWMAENLKTTRFNDGTAMPEVPDNAAWSGLLTPAYCWYNNTKAGNEKKGMLYNGYVITNEKIAPIGWHVPTYTDWDTLEDYLIANGFNYDGTTTGNKIAKSIAATSGWTLDNTFGNVGNDQATNNKSGFNALSAGYRNDVTGEFSTPGISTVFYSYYNSIIYLKGIDNYNYKPFGYPNNNLKQGYSIRCIKD
jgi:uncharacterized protein (TIGR02145 family)